MPEKQAALLEDVQLQPHQQRLADESSRTALRKLLIHGLGSGKTLTSIAAMERRQEPYSAVVPAAVRSNFNRELDKFTDRKLPVDVTSYTGVATGRRLPAHTENLVLDEAHRLRNPGSAQTQKVMELARNANQLLMLSATPLVNSPRDLAVPISLLTGKNVSPDEFEKRYVGERKVSPGILARLRGIRAGTEPAVAHADELKALLRGHVDYYQPDQPVVPTQYEDHHVEMSPQQHQLYRGMWDDLPFWLRWKMRHDFPLSRQELTRMTSFLTGPRQVGLSTLPYLRDRDPHKAFEQSPKLQKAFELLQAKLQDQRAKGLIFSNFIDAGLKPYAAALEKAKIPYGLFHGGLSDRERQRLVDEYNKDKLRVALIAPAGTEGLSFKGTQLIQLLDPYWNPIRGQQSIGRGLRYGSHAHLPEDLQNVTVQRFISRLPLGMRDRLLERFGLARTGARRGADDHLVSMAQQKERINQHFLDILKEVGQEKTSSRGLVP